MDRYQMRARVQPATLTAMPLALTFAVVLGLQRDLLSGLFGFLGAAGVMYFIAHLVRDRGRSLERSLWQSWGGAPTTQLLRGSSDRSSQAVIQRRWAVMSKLVPESSGDTDRPNEGDIETYVAVLRERTRSAENFPLVAAESAAYGFRRNMLGLRPIGIGSSVVALITAASVLVQHAVAGDGHQNTVLAVTALLDALFLSAWLFIINGGWVKEQAFNYAEALLGAAENLDVV